MPREYTVQTRNGPRTVVSTFETDSEAAFSLECSIKRANRKPSDFEDSLIQNGERGCCSTKQRAWLHVLATEMRESGKTLPVQSALMLPNILSLLRHAHAAGKQFPFLVFSGLRIKYASRGVNAGGAWIDSGVRWPGLGKITSEGLLVPAFAMKPEQIEQLAQIEKDPRLAAKQHGVATGICCYCSKELTDPASRTAGYGPICARKYGLP